MNNKGVKAMKRNIELERQALKHYEELRTLIEVNKNLSFEELCDKLGGHNLEDELFDINYKSICATVYHRNNLYILSSDIEIWQDEIGYLYDDKYDVYNMKQVIEAINYLKGFWDGDNITITSDFMNYVETIEEFIKGVN